MMKKQKTSGIVVTLTGLLITAVCLFADYLGLGDVDPDHFTLGTKQIAGTAFGVLVFIVGMVLWKKRSH